MAIRRIALWMALATAVGDSHAEQLRFVTEDFRHSPTQPRIRLTTTGPPGPSSRSSKPSARGWVSTARSSCCPGAARWPRPRRVRWTAFHRDPLAGTRTRLPPHPHVGDLALRRVCTRRQRLRVPSRTRPDWPHRCGVRPIRYLVRIERTSGPVDDVQMILESDNRRLMRMLQAGRFGGRGVAVVSGDVAWHLIGRSGWWISTKRVSCKAFPTPSGFPAWR